MGDCKPTVFVNSKIPTMFKTISSRIFLICIVAMVPSVFAIGASKWIAMQYEILVGTLRSESKSTEVLIRFDSTVHNALLLLMAEGSLDSDANKLHRSSFADYMSEASILLEQIEDIITRVVGEGDDSQNTLIALQDNITLLATDYDAIRTEKARLNAAVKNIENDQLNNSAELIASLKQIAFDANSQEYIANVTALETVILRLRLGVSAFTAKPSEQENKDVKALIRKMVDGANRARKTFRSGGKTEADALFKQTRAISKAWNAYAQDRVTFQEYTQNIITYATQQLEAQVLEVTRSLRAAGANIRNTIEGQTETVEYFGYILIGSFIAIVMIVLTMFTYRIGQSLTNLKRSMSAIAKGDDVDRIAGIDRSDDLGDMARDLQVFQDNAHEKQQLEQRQRNLKQQAEQQQREDMEQLAQRFEKDVETVASGLIQASEMLISLATNMQQTAENATGRASKARSVSDQAVEKVADSVKISSGMLSSIDEVLDKVSRTAQMSKQASQSALSTNDRVSKLENSAESIKNVVSLINDIAQQTNLLALNATIEAARAGEAGKGFAVVAGEVKNLANQTARATEQVSDYIESIQNDTENVVNSISQINSVIGDMRENTSSVSSAMNIQSNSTRDIASTTDSVADGIRDVSENISAVRQVVEDTVVSATEVLDSANQLSDIADTLTVSMKNFLNKLRAA